MRKLKIKLIMDFLVLIFMFYSGALFIFTKDFYYLGAVILIYLFKKY